MRFQKAHFPRKDAALLFGLESAHAYYRVSHARYIEPGIFQNVDCRAVGFDLHQGAVYRAANRSPVIRQIRNRLPWVAGVRSGFKHYPKSGPNEHPDRCVSGSLPDMAVHHVGVLVRQDGGYFVV